MSVLAGTPGWVGDATKVCALILGVCGVAALVVKWAQRQIKATLRPELEALDGKIDAVHTEVRSPNGTKTGDLAYETAKRVIEVREQMVEMRETQLKIQRRIEAHDDWAAVTDARLSRIEERLDPGGT